MLIVIGVTVWKYDAYVSRQDFLIYDQVACDPEIESCFAYVCEEGDEECDTEPFKKITKSAENVSLCPNYIEGECSPLSCAEDEVDCEEILCSEDTLEDGESCVSQDPELPEDTDETPEEPEAEAYEDA